MCVCLSCLNLLFPSSISFVCSLLLLFVHHVHLSFPHSWLCYAAPVGVGEMALRSCRAAGHRNPLIARSTAALQILGMRKLGRWLLVEGRRGRVFANVSALTQFGHVLLASCLRWLYVSTCLIFQANSVVRSSVTPECTVSVQMKKFANCMSWFG